MLEIVLTKPLTYGAIVVATAVAAVGSGVVAMVTVNDVAAYAAVGTTSLIGAYVAFRTARSTLDRAEEKTITGDLKRVRRENTHLKDRNESLESVVRTQSELIAQLRDQINASDT